MPKKNQEIEKFVLVYIQDGIAEPNVYFFQSIRKDIPKYLRDRIEDTIVLWDDFDPFDCKDSTGTKIPNNAIEFLQGIGISELEANESITIKAITI